MSKKSIPQAVGYTWISATVIEIDSDVSSFTADDVAYIYNRTQDILYYAPAPGLKGGGITVSGYQITITGATIVNTDELHVQIWGISTGEDQASNSVLTTGLNPDGQQVTSVLPIVTDYELTSAYASIAPLITMGKYKLLGLQVERDVNLSEDVDLKVLGRYEVGDTSGEIADIAVINLWVGGGADGITIYNFDTKKTIPYIDLQAIAGTVGGTPGTITVKAIISLI